MRLQFQISKLRTLESFNQQIPEWRGNGQIDELFLFEVGRRGRLPVRPSGRIPPGTKKGGPSMKDHPPTSKILGSLN